MLAPFSELISLMRDAATEIVKALHSAGFLAYFAGGCVRDGLMGKDDCIDTISMLTQMNPWKPNPEDETPAEQVSTDDPIWGTEAEMDEEVGLDAYVV